MKTSTIFLFGILLLSSFVSANAIMTMIAEEFLIFVLETVFDIGWRPLEELLFAGPANETVEYKLTEIIHKIDDLSTEFKHSVADIKDFVKLESRRNKIQDIQDQIEVKFNKTLHYIKHIKKLENDTVNDLIAYLSQGTTPIEDLSYLYHVKVFGKDKAFLEDAIDLIKKNKQHFVTKTGESEHVILFKYFLSLLSVEYKALVLQKLTYSLKKRLGKGRFKEEFKMAQKDFVRHVNEAIKSMRNAFLASSREIYKLDPPKHVRGETYEEVTRFDQVYFTSEANFGSCNSRCEDYSKPRHNFTEKFAIDQRLCRGTIHGCKSERQNNYYFYLPPNDTDVRYNLVATSISNNDKLSPKVKYGMFDENMKQLYEDKKAKITSYAKWIRGLVRCDICWCLCDEENDEKSVRKFSTSSVKSDTDRNMVVTGVKIDLSKNKVFYLKIRQSPLLPMGKVNISASEWKSLDNSKFPKNKTFKLLYTNNSIFVGSADLNDTKELDFVVTKVKFKEISGNLGLKVCFTKFNVTSGKLGTVIHVKCKLNNVSETLLNGETHGDRPIKYSENEFSETNENGLVQFTASNLHDDVGQSTVPFLDLQTVESKYAALSGVGLKFRTRDSSGGFITPSLKTRPFFDENKRIKYPDEINSIAIKTE